jgi:hypothetical protein
MKILKYVAIVGALFLSTAAFGETENKSKESPDKEVFMSFVLDKAKSYSGTMENSIAKAVDKVQEEAPIVMKEFLAWRLFRASLFAAIAFAFIIGLVILSVTCFKWAKEDDSLIFPALLCLVISVIPFLVFIDHILQAVQIYIAPRVYLIEQAINLLKK